MMWDQESERPGLKPQLGHPAPGHRQPLGASEPPPSDENLLLLELSG